MEPEDGHFGTVGGLSKLLNLIDFERDSLFGACQDLDMTHHWMQSTVLLASGVLTTLASFRPLSRPGGVGDCFVLARKAFETMVNIGVICALGDSASRRMERHAVQKRYRDLQRHNDFLAEYLGHSAFSFGVPTDDDVAAALLEFTGRKGREITQWTNETVEQRLEHIKKAFGHATYSSFRVPLWSIYRVSSEVLHGTLYGLSFEAGWMASGPIRSAELALLELLQMLLVQLASCTCGTVECIRKAGGLPLLNLREETIRRAKEVTGSRNPAQ